MTTIAREPAGYGQNCETGTVCCEGQSDKNLVSCPANHLPDRTLVLARREQSQGVPGGNARLHDLPHRHSPRRSKSAPSASRINTAIGASTASATSVLATWLNETLLNDVVRQRCGIHGGGIVGDGSKAAGDRHPVFVTETRLKLAPELLGHGSRLCMACHEA